MNLETTTTVTKMSKSTLAFCVGSKVQSGEFVPQSRSLLPEESSTAGCLLLGDGSLVGRKLCLLETLGDALVRLQELFDAVAGATFLLIFYRPGGEVPDAGPETDVRHAVEVLEEFTECSHLLNVQLVQIYLARQS
jgi:hypothetical protein